MDNNARDELNVDINYLIDRFYQQLEHQMKAENLKQKGIKKLEHMKKDRKTFINNFTAVCESMNRDSVHVSNYISAEMKIDTSISQAGVLVIHGTYGKQRIEEKIIKYIEEYVQCRMCKSLNTEVAKRDKIKYLDCNKCHANFALS